MKDIIIIIVNVWKKWIYIIIISSIAIKVRASIFTAASLGGTLSRRAS